MSHPSLPLKIRSGAFTASQDYESREEIWTMIEDLREGTSAMRSKGELYLPREDKETQKQWKNRLRRSWLFPRLRDTIDGIVSQPFSRPVTVREIDKLSDTLKLWATDPSYDGSSLDMFAEQLYDDLCSYGIAHIFTDYPETGGTQTRADERIQGLRPLTTRIHPRDVINWKYEKDANGASILKEVWIVEWADASSTDLRGAVFVRHITWDGTWTLYAPDKNGPKVARTGTSTFRGAIPLRTAYAKYRRPMLAHPPFRDLAEQNVKHWQGESDHNQLVRFARCATLTAVGISKEEKNDIILGVNQILWSSNPSAKFSFTEHTGQAIAASERDLSKTEDHMLALGARPLSAKADRTATDAILGTAKDESEAQSWVRRIEELIMFGLADAAQWVGEEVPEDVTIDIYSDFSMLREGTQMDTLLKMRSGGDISRKTLLQEAQRRGFFSVSFNPEDEDGIMDDTTDVTVEPEAPVVEEAAVVQDTALNGAQTTALIDLAVRVQMRELTKEQAIAIGQASFPLVKIELFEKMFPEPTDDNEPNAPGPNDPESGSAGEAEDVEDEGSGQVGAAGGSAGAV